MVRAHGSSQVNAQPSNAMPMGPVTAHMSNATRISPLRHDITAMISRALSSAAWERDGVYNSARRRRNAFAMTDTELKVIAALAIIGLSKRPTTGYRTPAAMGTPSAL